MPKYPSKRGGSEKIERETSKSGMKIETQMNNLMKEYEKEQAEHILTQEKLRETQNGLADYENLVNEMSATTIQKDTQIFELGQKLEETKIELIKLQEDNNQLRGQLSKGEK